MVVVSDRLPARRGITPVLKERSGSDDFLDGLISWERLGAVIAEHRLALAAVGAGLALMAALGFSALPQDQWLHHTRLLLIGRRSLIDLCHTLHALALPTCVAAGALLVTDGLLAIWPRRRTPWHVLVAAQPFLPLPLFVPLIFYLALLVLNVVLWIALVIFLAGLAVCLVIGFFQSLWQSI